jgi:hypothetical protein
MVAVSSSAVRSNVTLELQARSIQEQVKIADMKLSQGEVAILYGVCVICGCVITTCVSPCLQGARSHHDEVCATSTTGARRGSHRSTCGHSLPGLKAPCVHARSLALPEVALFCR